jgi:hypothetical protein
VTYGGGAHRRGRKRGVGVVEGPQEDVLLLLAGLLLGRGGARRLAARTTAADPAMVDTPTTSSAPHGTRLKPRLRNAARMACACVVCVCVCCVVCRESGRYLASASAVKRCWFSSVRTSVRSGTF